MHRFAARLTAISTTLIVVGVALASAAHAHTRANARTARAMHAALTKRDCPAKTGIRDATVSTANRRYGSVACGPYGHFVLVLRRANPRAEKWHVVFDMGDGIQNCSTILKHVPHRVAHDLRLGGIFKSGAEGLC